MRLQDCDSPVIIPFPPVMPHFVKPRLAQPLILLSAISALQGATRVGNTTLTLPAYQSYSEWRITHFGPSPSTDGDPAVDPDQDQRTNRDEWLEHTDPNDPGDFWTPAIDTSGPGLPVLRYDLPNRSVTIESSANLQQWIRWNHLENDGIPPPPASPGPSTSVPPRHTNSSASRWKNVDRHSQRPRPADSP